MYKNKLLTNSILEAQKEFDIIFIQELLWLFIQSILSLLNMEGEDLVRVLNYPNWITFSRNTSNNYDSLKVILYINVRLSNFWFFLWKDIFNYKNIFCISFFNCSFIYFLINVYSNLSQTALKYLKDTEANINNILVITGNFNIRDNSWDLSFSHQFIHHDTLTDIADSINLCISNPTNYHKMNYLLICDIWNLGILSEV